MTVLFFIMAMSGGMYCIRNHFLYHFYYWLENTKSLCRKGQSNLQLLENCEAVLSNCFQECSGFVDQFKIKLESNQEEMA